MKRIIILIILIMIVISCADLAAARERRRVRGRVCYENYKGEFLGCRYADE